jgi:hypothetical protein
MFLLNLIGLLACVGLLLFVIVVVVDLCGGRNDKNSR